MNEEMITNVFTLISKIKDIRKQNYIIDEKSIRKSYFNFKMFRFLGYNKYRNAVINYSIEYLIPIDLSCNEVIKIILTNGK